MTKKRGKILYIKLILNQTCSVATQNLLHPNLTTENYSFSVRSVGPTLVGLSGLFGTNVNMKEVDNEPAYNVTLWLSLNIFAMERREVILCILLSYSHCQRYKNMQFRSAMILW